jgi:deoxyadenosine/deoxycytidine kinase
LRTRHPDWTFISEPVDTWSSIRNERGESLLQVFYHDRKRWSYTFQNCALLTRYQNIEAAVRAAGATLSSGKHIFVTERCLETDYHVFAKMLKDDNSLDELEFSLYTRWFDMLQQTATPLRAVVHVKTDPGECALRIQSRAREGEDSIPLEYLQSLEVYQNKWLESLAIPSIPTSSTDLADVETFIMRLA